jgi:Zn-dependent peptidase ImmA (M78 family)
MIEQEALDILQSLPRLKWPLDPTRVAEWLGLDIDIINLPLQQENDIVALIAPLEKKILINENSDKLALGLANSSIAHEVGHWVLHIDQREVDIYLNKYQLGLKVEVPPPLHRLYGEKAQNRIESQSQYFAACLLMPQFKLEETRKGRNLTRWQHLYAMAEELDVTISNLVYRLQCLEWIYIPKNSKQIYRGNCW